MNIICFSIVAELVKLKEECKTYIEQIDTLESNQDSVMCQLEAAKGRLTDADGTAQKLYEEMCSENRRINDQLMGVEELMKQMTDDNKLLQQRVDDMKTENQMLIQSNHDGTLADMEVCLLEVTAKHQGTYLTNVRQKSLVKTLKENSDGTLKFYFTTLFCGFRLEIIN